MCKFVSTNIFDLGNDLDIDFGVIHRYACWKALSQLTLYTK